MTSLAEIHNSGDYLTHEKLWVASLKTSAFDYRNGYFLTSPGRWRGFDWRHILEQPPRSTVLVIGHSDLEVTPDTVETIRSVSDARYIFASNASATATTIPGVIDLPLGIPNDERQSRTHIIQADAGLIRKAWAKGKPPRNHKDVVLYANFSIRNNPPERAQAWEALKESSWARRGQFELSRRGRLRDLTAMRNSGLVVCPPGGGMDTHRFWEALLVGAVPVTKLNDHSARIARLHCLPVITVDSWSDLRSKEFLIEEYRRVMSQEWDFSPLTSQFWLNEILSKSLGER